MWDVKLISQALPLRYEVFYLNYVGCKVALENSGFTGLKVFYLNYVGCKDSISEFFHLPRDKVFYLNYVGCKVLM